jgi:adenosyl cobinamide kinase/adenosyl cobinamide phosphate guanylyltransferase
MLNQSSTEYQYNIILDILAEMVTNYLTKNDEKDLSEDKKEDDKHVI